MRVFRAPSTRRLHRTTAPLSGSYLLLSLLSFITRFFCFVFFLFSFSFFLFLFLCFLPSLFFSFSFFLLFYFLSFLPFLSFHFFPFLFCFSFLFFPFPSLFSPPPFLFFPDGKHILKRFHWLPKRRRIAINTLFVV